MNNCSQPNKLVFYLKYKKEWIIMESVKQKMYDQLFEEYKEISNLDPLSIKYIFETWKMTKEINEHIKNTTKLDT